MKEEGRKETLREKWEGRNKTKRKRNENGEGRKEDDLTGEVEEERNQEKKKCKWRQKEDR